MDDIVRQAMAKWPNVPHCYGWLGLDERGNWYMRDDRVQAAGPFPQSKGSLLRHEKLIDFIHRNYDHDEDGQWFFQNGPQRVYVELQAAPWIWRVAAADAVSSHTGRTAQVQASFLDETGRLYLSTDLGFGLVHTQDIVQASELVELFQWLTEEESGALDPDRPIVIVADPERERERVPDPLRGGAGCRPPGR